MVDDLKFSNKNKLTIETKIGKNDSIEINSSTKNKNNFKAHQNMTIWSNNENEHRNERYNLIRRSSNLNMTNSSSASKETKKSLADIPSQVTNSTAKKFSSNNNTSKIMQKNPSFDVKILNNTETELKAQLNNASIEDHFDTQTLSEGWNNKSNLKLNVSTINLRPPTAKSLPSKVLNEENETASGRLKNPSCPNILPPLAKIINVSTIGKDNQELNSNELIKQNETEKSLNKLSISSSISKKPSIPCSIITSNSPSSKSNLDYFLDITSNPFTTKFEIIGTENKSQRPPIINKHKSGTKPITGSNFSLKEIENSSGITRSQSISNLNDKTHVENIISPNLVKPYTTNDQETNISTIKSKNLSTTNLSSLNDGIPTRYSITSIKPNSDEYAAITATGANDESMKKNFLRITDDIFIGSMSSIKNERKMCRLGIEYLIDMTNMRPDDLNRQTLGKLPCLCKRQHSRLYLTLEVTETSFKNLFSAFSEVNKFIQMAKKTPSSKRVLIFGKEPLSQKVICACAQYLMVEYEMDLETALQVILQKNYSSNKFKIEKCYLNYLQQFQSYLNHLSVNLYGTSQADGRSNKQENEKLEFAIRHDLTLNTEIITNRKLNQKFFEYDDDDEDFDESNDSNENENSDLIDQIEDKLNSRTPKVKSKNTNSDSDDFYEEENFTRLAKKGPVKFSKLPQSGANEIESKLNKNNSEYKMAWM